MKMNDQKQIQFPFQRYFEGGSIKSLCMLFFISFCLVVQPFVRVPYGQKKSKMMHFSIYDIFKTILNQVPWCTKFLKMDNIPVKIAKMDRMMAKFWEVDKMMVCQFSKYKITTICCPVL